MNQSDDLTAPKTDDSSHSWLYARVVVVTLLGLASAVFTKLGLFAALFTLLCFLSLPKWERAALRPLHWALFVAAIASSFGLVRFIVSEAMPGIVQGGTSATGQRAVSRLREILFAEDTMRRKGFADADGDGIGSAALLGELTGEVGLRGKNLLAPPLLERYPRLVQTARGPAAEISGYLFIVCIPKASGGFTGHPGIAIDEERAERRFLAYAWPSAPGRGLSEAYFLDEHERILIARSKTPGSRARTGVDSPPACDDAIAEDTRNDWQPWRDKKPRESLPGDKR